VLACKSQLLLFAGSLEAGSGGDNFFAEGIFGFCFSMTWPRRSVWMPLRSVLELGLEPGGAEPPPNPAHPIPHYLRFERPPVVEPAEPMVLGTGEHIGVTTKYYDYGVVSIELELPFECSDWISLVLQSSRWIAPRNLRIEPTNCFGLLWSAQVWP